MLTVWNPFKRSAIDVKPANVVSSESLAPTRWDTLDSYFDQLIPSTFGNMFESLMRPYQQLFGSNYTANEDGSMSITLDVPGVKQEDVSVEVKQRTVHIKAERKGNTYANFVQSFTVPSEYDLETLGAELADGVLTITIKPTNKPESTAKKIEVISKTLPAEIKAT